MSVVEKLDVNNFEIKDGLILKTRCGRFERSDDKNLEKINKGCEKNETIKF